MSIRRNDPNDSLAAELITERDQLRRKLIDMGNERDRMTREVRSLRSELQEVRTEILRIQADTGTGNRFGQGASRPLPPLREEEFLNASEPTIDAIPKLPPDTKNTKNTNITKRPEPTQNSLLSRRLSVEEYEAMPFGLLTVDAVGRVLAYQSSEPATWTKEALVGQGFFAQIAPARALKEYGATFADLAQNPARVFVKTFDFLCSLPLGEHHISVIISPARLRGRYHVGICQRQVLPR